MTSDQVSLVPVRLFDKSPIDVARDIYAKFARGLPFNVDVRYYLENGIVISRPDIFVMASIVDLRPKDADGVPIGDTPQLAWFCRCAVGELKRILSVLPAHLPKICFCRKGQTRLRVYPTDKFLVKVNKGK